MRTIIYHYLYKEANAFTPYKYSKNVCIFQVMNCDFATSASDMWGIGVITYQLCSGGISPFFAINRFRTMAKVLEVDYSLEQAELCKASPEAKDFISRLLVRDPEKRLSASQCLSHPWLQDDKLYLGILQTLETIWMRKCLARRRWYRIFNAICVMQRVKSLADAQESAFKPNAWSSSEDDMVDGMTLMDKSSNLIQPYIHPISRYYRLFFKV